MTTMQQETQQADVLHLLDEGSFVEIGGAVTARSTDFNMQEKAAPSTVLLRIRSDRW